MSPESIYMSPHEPDLCPNFTLGTERRLAATVADRQTCEEVAIPTIGLHKLL